jgi:hypothetical protein
MEPKELYKQFQSDGGRFIPQYIYENSFFISDDPLYEELKVKSPVLNISELDKGLTAIGIEFIQKAHNLNELLTLPMINQLTHHQNVQFYQILGRRVGYEVGKKNITEEVEIQKIYDRIYDHLVEEDADQFQSLEFLEQYYKKALSSLHNTIREGAFVRNQIYLLAQSTLSLAWTTYETTCESLWLNLVKSQNSKYLENALRSFKTKGEEIFNIDRMIANDFKIKEELPSILLAQCSFSSPENIYKSFRKILPESSHLSNIKNNKILNFLQRVRNLFVHSSAVVDSAFIKDAPKEFIIPDQMLGTPFILSSKSVTSLIDESIMQGEQLINFVNDLHSKLGKSL